MNKEKKFWKKYQEADSSKRQKMMGELFEPKPKYFGGLVGGFIALSVGASIMSQVLQVLNQNFKLDGGAGLMIKNEQKRT